jgi:pimeloyl-[acyl-carrier protein] methyl ester esterase
MINHLVLLPGLDGTGELFSDFVAALPKTIITHTVSYPDHEFLPYVDLRPFVIAAIPRSEPFVLLGESFSSPLAVEFAATKPSNLAALIICSGFVSRPLGAWSSLAKVLAWSWVFKLTTPRFLVEYFGAGRHAPQALIQKARQVRRSVSPKVMSGRTRQVLAYDARLGLAQVTVPILCVAGTEEHLLAKSCLREMMLIKPEMFVARVAGPHMLLQREPRKIAEIISKFMHNLKI